MERGGAGVGRQMVMGGDEGMNCSSDCEMEQEMMVALVPLFPAG